jgi:putative transposase
MKGDHSIEELCELFEVSRSGYYDWCTRQSQPGARAQQDILLAQQIRAIYREHQGTYGSPRIQKQLARSGSRHGRNRIARLMREHNLCGAQRRRYRVVTTDSDHDLPIAPNRLATTKATAPNQVWVGDITYIKTPEGWLYLAAIMDLYSRRIVGWAMSHRIDTALVLMAWQMATLHRQPSSRLLFHSDRGVQYASTDFRNALQSHGAIPSMSRKACCYDNAAMEAFWSTLKRELIYRQNFDTALQVRQAIFAYIETHYNRRRLHSALGYLSPIEFEQHNPGNN